MEQSTKTKSAAEMFAQILENYRIVDLSVTTGDDLPCAPVEGVFGKFVWNKFGSPRGEYVEYILTHDDHVGTHMDCPSHFVNTGDVSKITLEKIELEKLMGPAAVVDLRFKLDSVPPGENTTLSISPVITVDDLMNWEKNNGEFQKGEVVLLYTGWSELYYKRYPEGYKFDRSHPAPSAEAVEYLAKKGIGLVGMDTLGLGLMQDDYQGHIAAGKAGMIVVEKLINFDQLPTRGSFFIFLPHKFEGISGGLGRALAFV